jgi:hypothetical protein
MFTLKIKIDKLKYIMNKKIELNDYEINDEIINISQILDELIVKYENLKISKKCRINQG